ncbi:alpha-S1-casein [Trichechus inunguis]
MKLLILTCLVAFTLARPSEQDSSSSEEVLKEKKFLKFALPTPEELREEYINELNRQRVMAEAEQHTPKEDMLSQCYLEQLCRMNQYNLLQLPFQQFYQLDAYPTGARYYPLQIMPFIPLQPFPNVAKPIAPENVENTDIMPEWW